MKKRWFLALVLAAAVAGGAFAQTDFQTMPKNTITVDVGPAILGAILGVGANMLDECYEGTSGFGIAAQYERQLLERLSVGARFAYGGGTLKLSFEEDFEEDAEYSQTQFSSYSIEGHVRFYPFAKTFFMDGMLGYAKLTANYEDSDLLKIAATLDYFKFGYKVGWRINFGKPGAGGFTFEPAIGFYRGIPGIGKNDSVNDTIVTKFKAAAGGGEDWDDEMLTGIEQLLFVGGPRLTLAFGWRF